MSPEPAASENEATLSLGEAADLLGVHYNTAYRYVRHGRLQARQVNGEWRIRPGDLAAAAAAPRSRGRRGAPDWEHRRDQLLDRLVAGDGEGAWDLLEAALDAGAEIGDMHQQLLGPAMRTIGERWADGDLHIDDEHRATATVSLLLGRLSGRSRRRGRRRGTVVVGAAAGDHHSLPVAMMADLLRHRGFHVLDLGCDVPAPSFQRTVAAVDHLLAVLIYAGAPGNDDAVRGAVEAIHQQSPGTPVVVGGSAIADMTSAAAVGADHWGESPDQIVALLDDRAGEPRVRAVS